MAIIVARVSELLFHENETVHTVAYDRKARNVIKQFPIEGRQLRLAVGDREDVFTSLRRQLTSYLVKRELDPKDFGFRVSHSDMADDSTFLDCTFHTTIGSEMPVFEAQEK